MDQTGNPVKIQIGRGIKYKNLPPEAIDKLHKDLIFDNPKYKQAEKYGSYIGADVDPHIFFVRRSPDKKVYWTPRGYIWFIKRWLKNNNYEIALEDKTLLFSKIDVEFNGKLRDYQESAVDDIVRRYPVGVLEAATGSGKTVMATAIIARRKQKTLIIVHSKELLYQWQDSLKKFLDYDCGIVGDGKFEIKDITVGIINTVKNRVDELSDKFGQVICDEVHRSPSVMWTDTLSEFPARHYLGLSATPYRKDGLGNAIYCTIGPKLHSVDKKKLHESGAVLKPQIILVKTPYKFGRSWADEEDASYAKIISDLTANNARNKLICTHIKNDLKRYNENILVVSDRVTHCEKIADILKSMKIESHLLHGKVPKGERKYIVDDLKDGKVKVLIATISLIGEGFDAPALSSLFLTTPIKFSGRVIQTVGRVLRPEKGKLPRVYDFREENVRVLRNSGYTRNSIYKKQGWI